MARVAILVAASPTPGFYSQVAAMCLALRNLPWRRWQPSIHLYIGGDHETSAYTRWLPQMRDVEINWVSHRRFAREGDWAQSDDVFRFAPRDADLLLAMDADTLPVSDFEEVLDRVVDTGSVAGVIAHLPFPPFPDVLPREGWARVTRGLIDAPLIHS